MTNANPIPVDLNRYPLRQIYFYLTRDCNLRCRHCWISPDFQSATTSSSYLPLDLFKSIIAEARPLGLNGLKLTGGEPLLHPQILDILDVIRAEGLAVSIETNGVLCSAEIARAIASCKVTGVSISLDGVTAETHEWVRCVDGCFDDALAGFKNLQSAGIRPQIIMSVMRHNRDEILPMVDFAASVQAASLKFNIVTPTLRGQAMHEAGETLTIEELVELGDLMEKEIIKKSPVPVLYSHPSAFNSLGNMFGERKMGCSVCGILGIIGVLADGTYALCGIGEAIPDLTYGNARADKLSDVWADAPFLKEIRAGLPSKLEGVCSKCLMKKICLGSCIAQNYYRSGSLWAPYWYCEQAQKSGLFPEKRLW